MFPIGTQLVGYNRMKFLIESLADLDEQIKENGGTGLLIFQGKPTTIFRKLHEQLGVNKICYEHDCEPIWNKRDSEVESLCHELGIEKVEKVSHTLWNPMDIINANGGFSPLTYEMMIHTVNCMGLPPRPMNDKVDFSGIEFGKIPQNLHFGLGLMKQVMFIVFINFDVF
jgi:cryptochrome